MPGSKEILRRIKSVKSTRKITKAMQMVSAAKMRKAQRSALQSRSFEQAIRNLASSLPPGIDHELFRVKNPSGPVLTIVIGSNKGLVGSFNANLLSKLLSDERATDKPIKYASKGRKVKEGLVRLKKDLQAEFVKSDKNVAIEEVYELASFATRGFISGEYSQVNLLFNRFKSTISQKPEVVQLLPFTLTSGTQSEEIFEPSEEEVLNAVIPRIIESIILQALLESDAGEHSARMMMMKNATDAAGDIILDLTLTYNQIRQNKITTELAEITSGKLALESAN